MTSDTQSNEFFAFETIMDAAASFVIALLFTVLSYQVAARLGADLATLTAIEYLGVLFNFACVWSTARQNPWAWVFGAVGAVLLGILFWNIGLLSSMVMSLAYYLPIQFYGLWCWLKGGDDGNGAKVSRMTKSEVHGVVLAVPAAILVWAWFIGSYTNAVEVYLDAAVFGFSIAAQYLLTNKRVESWPLWGVINVLSVILYWKTGASILAVQYALFFIHAVYGTVLWMREYRARMVAA